MTVVTALLTATVSVGVAHADPAAPQAHASIGPSASAVAAQSTGNVATTAAGYWEVASDGGVTAFGPINYGGLRGVTLHKPIVGMAATPDGKGYWLVASDGGIFAFGDARYFGSTGSIALNKPIVGMTATADGLGYWLVASDGGIFAFGDATFYGSTGGIVLNKAVVGMAATPDGLGYWLVASDGGIFAYGDAGFYGSTGGTVLNKAVVGMATTPDGLGYWLVASDGGIFAYGDTTFYGSTGGTVLNEPIVGMSASPDGPGYLLVASDGGIFAYGDTIYRGSGQGGATAEVVGIAATTHGYSTPLTDASGDPYSIGSTGYDVSFPQCVPTLSLPASGAPLSIVGVNDGRSPLDAQANNDSEWNPCFPVEERWAGTNLSVYLNIDNLTVPTGSSLSAATTAGVLDAVADVSYVAATGYEPQVWWLDVEAPCGYSGKNSPLWLCGPSTNPAINGTDANLALNAAVIEGAISTLQGDGFVVGVYSTYLQWPATAGTLVIPGLPIWIAGAASLADFTGYCTDPYRVFADGTPLLVQWSPTGNGSLWDEDYACA